MKTKTKLLLAAFSGLFTLGALSVRAAEETVTMPATEQQKDTDLELTQKMNNPIASIILMPLQVNFDFNTGKGGSGWRNVNNIQPVAPFKLTEDYTLITRTVIPYVYQQDRYFKGSGVQQGFSDTSLSMFVSRNAKIGETMWGVGPVFMLPTATQDLLGTKQWGAGPAAIILKQTSHWTYGGLVNQVWAFAGQRDRTYNATIHGETIGVPINGGINMMFMQPFLSYVTPALYTMSVTSEASVNWKATPGNQWTVPIDFLVSHIYPCGPTKMAITLGARWYAIRPDLSPTWGVRAVFTIFL